MSAPATARNGTLQSHGTAAPVVGRPVLAAEAGADVATDTPSTWVRGRVVGGVLTAAGLADRLEDGVLLDGVMVVGDVVVVLATVVVGAVLEHDVAITFG